MNFDDNSFVTEKIEDKIEKEVISKIEELSRPIDHTKHNENSYFAEITKEFNSKIFSKRKEIKDLNLYKDECERIIENIKFQIKELEEGIEVDKLTIDKLKEIKEIRRSHTQEQEIISDITKFAKAAVSNSTTQQPVVNEYWSKPPFHNSTSNQAVKPQTVTIDLNTNQPDKITKI